MATQSSLRAFAVGGALALVLLAVGLTANQVHAAARTITVNTTADGHQGGGATCASPAAGGACTLRAAIELADNESGDTVSVPAGTYALDPAITFLHVTSPMTITGAGPAATIIDGGNAGDGVFFVEATLSMSGVTLRNGAAGGLTFGGCLQDDSGPLTLTNVVVTGCTAPRGLGGGIAAGSVSLDQVVISGNEAGEAGGLLVTGMSTIRRSTISDNVADGILSFPGTPNPRLPGHGGGIDLLSTGGFVPHLTITQSTISGNMVKGPAFNNPPNSPLGGGIYNFGGVLHMANDTVTGNVATEDNPGNVPPAGGGGIAQTFFGVQTPVSEARTNAPRLPLRALLPKIVETESAAFTRADTVPNSSATTLDFVTLAANRAQLIGGIAKLTGDFTVTNTIVSANNGGDCGVPGSVTSGGYNIDGGTDCGFKQVGDQSNVDPKLDTLKLNPPGVTATMALLPGSPAIDAADPHCDQNMDQRGVIRPEGPRCDIGAYEVGNDVAPSATPSLPSPPVTGATAVAMASARGVPAIAGTFLALIAVALLGARVRRRRTR